MADKLLPNGLPALGLITGLQAQWDACYGPTRFGDPNNQGLIDATRFMQRVSMAVSAYALSIMNEAATTPNHVNRMALVKAVLGNPPGWNAAFAQAFAAHGLDQSSTDTQIGNGPAAVWDAFAGPP